MTDTLHAPDPHVTYPRYLPLPGVPQELELFPPDLLASVNEQLVAEAIGNRDAREAAEREAATLEEEERAFAEEVQADLFDADDYAPPPLEHLVGRRPNSGSKRRNIGGVPLILAELDDLELRKKLWWVWKHQRLNDGRGLRPHDRHLQREWLNRASGYSLVRDLATKGNLGLPQKYLPLANKRRRSHARESIVRLLMLLDGLGWNGFYLSETEAVESGLVGSTAQWWRAMAQLRSWGVVVYLRTWKPGFYGRKADRERNWYGIGPAMIKKRAAYLTELGHHDAHDELEALNREAERRRARKAGKRRGPRTVNVLESLPRWHVVLVGKLTEEAEARARFRRECERADAVRADYTAVLDDPGPLEIPPAVDLEQSLELEQAVQGAAPAVAPGSSSAPCRGSCDASVPSSAEPKNKALSSRENPSGTLELKLKGTPSAGSAELGTLASHDPRHGADDDPGATDGAAAIAPHRASSGPPDPERAPSRPPEAAPKAAFVPNPDDETIEELEARLRLELCTPDDDDPDRKLDPAELESLLELKRNPIDWAKLEPLAHELADACEACLGVGLPALGGCALCGR